MDISLIDLTKGEEMNFLSPNKEIEIENVTNIDQDKINKNIETCKKCEFMLETRHCSICGCPVVMMAQVGFNTCPKGLWE